MRGDISFTRCLYNISTSSIFLNTVYVNSNRWVDDWMLFWTSAFFHDVYCNAFIQCHSIWVTTAFLYYNELYFDDAIYVNSHILVNDWYIFKTFSVKWKQFEYLDNGPICSPSQNYFFLKPGGGVMFWEGGTCWDPVCMLAYHYVGLTFGVLSSCRERPLWVFLRSAYKMIRCVSRSIHSWVRHIMQIIELGKW